jgi:hypothetical protein
MTAGHSALPVESRFGLSGKLTFDPVCSDFGAKVVLFALDNIRDHQQVLDQGDRLDVPVRVLRIKRLSFREEIPECAFDTIFVLSRNFWEVIRWK